MGTHPLVANAVQNLRGSTMKQKFKRLNLLLRSLDGTKPKTKKSNNDETLHFSPVYERDRELDKVFWDFGGHASRIAFIKGWSHLLVDDDKTRLRSKKVAELCLVRPKSNKAFGAVGHCVMSMYTGIQLSCQYSHFGESTSDSLLNNLCIIQGVTSPKSIDLGETLVGGDRGYDPTFTNSDQELDVDFLSTVKRGANLPVKFGSTRYRTNGDQLDIPEHGPMLTINCLISLGIF